MLKQIEKVKDRYSDFIYDRFKGRVDLYRKEQMALIETFELSEKVIQELQDCWHLTEMEFQYAAVKIATDVTKSFAENPISLGWTRKYLLLAPEDLIDEMVDELSLLNLEIGSKIATTVTNKIREAIANLAEYNQLASIRGGPTIEA